MSNEINELKDEEKEKLEQELASGDPRSDQGQNWQGSSWIAGLGLILLGVFFLASTLFDFNFVGNWWAIFILIPAFYSFSRAWNAYRVHGHLTGEARGNLIGGLFIGIVGFVFLFGLSFANWWPLFLIVVGIGVLLKTRG